MGVAECSQTLEPTLMAPTLLSLPRDVLLSVLLRLEPSDLVLGVSRACRALHAAAACDDELWRALLASRYATLLRAVFAGAVPPPAPGAPGAGRWREHYFSFRDGWTVHAHAAGRLVMVIDGLLLDATPFLDEHPGGAELLVEAASTDASAAFDAVGHSPNARLILERLALPDLDLPCDGRRRPPTPPPNGRWSSGAAGLVSGALAGSEGRERLRRTVGSLLFALWEDLTEGRPDKRRLSPAVWQIATAQRAAATPG